MFYIISRFSIFFKNTFKIIIKLIINVANNLQINTVPARCDVNLLYKSENFIILDKPYDMVINSNNPRITRSVQMIMREMFPNLINPNLHHEFHFVHRLDFATSGVLCIALNKKAAQIVSLAFEQRTVQKYYLALVHGHIEKSSMIIDVPIGEDIREINKSNRMCTSDDSYCQKPRQACTALLVLEKGYQQNKAITKVLLYPKTGRRHQLRVHCKYIGHVIVGDYTYSEKTDTEPYRTFLHALRLIIDNTLEYLDVQTVDPFTSNDHNYQWKSTKVIRNLDESAYLDVRKLVL